MGVPVSQAEAVSAPSGTATTIAITVSAHQEDDILEIVVDWKGNQAPTVLTGWTHRFTLTTGTATTGIGQGQWWRRVGVGETVSDPTLTIGTTAVERRAICHTIRGADIDNPANTFWQKQQTVGNSATPTPPAITTLVPNYLLLHSVACRGNSAVTPPTGYNEEQDTAEGTTVCLETSTKTQATAATVSGQAASITSARWVASIVGIPSSDYAYFRSATSTTANGTSVTGTLPSGTTDDDFYDRADGMLAIVKAAGSGVTVTPTDSAWLNLTGWDLDTSTGSDSIEAFWAEYASGRNLNFARSGSGNIAVQLLTYRNVHQTAFNGNSSAKTQTGTPSTFDAQARLNTKSTVVSVIVADADTNNVHTAPSGFTERSDGLGIGSADRVYEDTGTTPSGSWTTTNAANIVGLIEILSHAGAAPSTAYVAQLPEMSRPRFERTAVIGY